MLGIEKGKHTIYHQINSEPVYRHTQEFSLRKYKLKQWYRTAHLLKWPKPKTLAIPNTGDDVEQKEFPFIAGVVQNGTDTVEDSLVVFLGN